MTNRRSAQSSNCSREMEKPKKGSAVQAQLSKTKLCVFNLQGKCRAANCKFAHSLEELQKKPDLSKTRLCESFISGKCERQNCKFAHGVHELQTTNGVYKTQLCIFHARGFCKKGQACRHAHGNDDLRQSSSLCKKVDVLDPNFQDLPMGIEQPPEDGLVGREVSADAPSSIMGNEYMGHTPTPMKSRDGPDFSLMTPVKKPNFSQTPSTMPPPTPATPMAPTPYGWTPMYNYEHPYTSEFRQEQGLPPCYNPEFYKDCGAMRFSNMSEFVDWAGVGPGFDGCPVPYREFTPPRMRLGDATVMDQPLDTPTRNLIGQMVDFLL